VQTLLDDLTGAAILTATGAWWQEQGTDYQTMNTDTRSTAMVLDAFLQVRPDSPLLPNVVRWLMAARSAGRWASTQENAWSIIALTDYMASTGELAADYGWTATLNEDELGQRALRGLQGSGGAAHRHHRPAARRGEPAAAGAHR
jgi:hypothetical protein